MSDERRQQPTVNLQELERQLREAARARQRAQATAGSNMSQQSERPVQSASSNPQAQKAQTYPQPGPPYTQNSYPQYASSSSSGQPAQPVAPSSFRSITPHSTASSQPTNSPGHEFVASPQALSRELSRPQATQNFPAHRQEAVRQSDEGQFDSALDVLKTGGIENVYPPVETGPVEQDQFYSAAAYDEPAAIAYDRYTEDQFPPIEQEPRSGGIVRVLVWVLGAAIILTGVYYAWPIVHGLFSPMSQTAKAPPLIKADPAPVKVEPDTQPQDNTNVPKDILTKHANENPNAAQMGPAAEQPADVNSAVKIGAAMQGAGAKPPLVPLVPGTGEPRVVKTVTVRADGTIIPEKSDPALAAKTVAPTPKVITIPQPVSPVAAPPALQPQSPASQPELPTKPVAVSPEFTLAGDIPLPPERLPDSEQDLGMPLDAVTTPMPETPVNPPAPAAAAPVPGKDFAVQFGAPETEAKGNELKARVEKQFASALAGGSVAVVKGESNGRAVFRVRAIGYSREEANAVCQQVTAASGQCFVSRNN